MEEEKLQDPSDAPLALRASTVWHGGELPKGPWSVPPSYLKPPAEPTNYLPKKWIHTFTGHTRGVTKARFYPRAGHLMLTSSLDGKVKIWDALTHRKCLRTYIGHGSNPVRDIAFSDNGAWFLSGGNDGQMA